MFRGVSLIAFIPLVVVYANDPAMIDMLPDSSFYATSEHSEGTSAIASRFSDIGWCTDGGGVVNEYLEIDLLELKEISAVGSKKKEDNNCQRVETYTIYYSVDGSAWTSYNCDCDMGKVLMGIFSCGSNDERRVVLSPTIHARYIRFHPQSYYDYACMRVEAYGVPYTFQPTISPTSSTHSPTSAPTFQPTRLPSDTPTSSPTVIPSSDPTSAPSSLPTRAPSQTPTDLPSITPTRSPTNHPSNAPTSLPSSIPSSDPSVSPSRAPTLLPSLVPSFAPTKLPIQDNDALAAAAAAVSPQFYVAAAVFVIFLLVAIGGFWHALYCPKNDFFSAAGIFSAMFDELNVIFDIFVAIHLYFFYLQDLRIFFFVSVACVLIPAFLSIAQLWSEGRKHWQSDERVNTWLTRNAVKLYAMSFVSGSSFIAVKLANSHLFGLDALSMHLSQPEYRGFQRKKLYSIVLFKNVPQLAIQSIVLAQVSFSNNLVVMLAMLFSVISILSTMIYVCSRNGDAASDGKLEVEIDVVAWFDALSRYKNSVNRIQQELSSFLQLDPRHIEVCPPTCIANGLSVTIRFNAQHNHAAVTLSVLRRAQQDGTLARVFKQAWKLSADPQIDDVRFVNADAGVDVSADKKAVRKPHAAPNLMAVESASPSPQVVVSSFSHSGDVHRSAHFPTVSDFVIPGSMSMVHMNANQNAPDLMMMNAAAGGQNMVGVVDDADDEVDEEDDDVLLAGLNGMANTLGGDVQHNALFANDEKPVFDKRVSLQKEGRPLPAPEFDDGPGTAGGDAGVFANMADDEFEIVDDDEMDDGDGVIQTNETINNTRQ